MITVMCLSPVLSCTCIYPYPSPFCVLILTYALSFRKPFLITYSFLPCKPCFVYPVPPSLLPPPFIATYVSLTVNTLSPY